MIHKTGRSRRWKAPASAILLTFWLCFTAGFWGTSLAGPPPSRVVDDDLAECPAADHTTVQAAVAAAAPGETILICPGTYSEPTITIDKALTLTGSSTGNTFIESAAAGVILLLQSGDFAVSDLTLRNGLQGLRFELAGATFTGATVDNVRFEGLTSRGIEIHNDTTVNDLTVRNSQFVNNLHGIRLASSATVTGLTVIDSVFDNEAIGIYEANDGSTSTLTDVLVTGCTFTGHTTAGIFAEEIRDALVEDNTFTGNRAGVLVFKNYTSAGVGVENLTIRGNRFTDHTAPAFLYWQLTSGLAGPVVFENNVIAQDVGLLTANFALIDVRLDGGFNHAPVTIRDNEVTLSGTFGGGATAAYAVQLRGNPSAVTIETNTFDGGGVADLGGLPPSSAVYLRSDDADFGPITSSSVVDLLCNTMTGFVNGVAVYDPESGTSGGLPAGAAVTMRGNNVAGNSGFGVDNGGTSATLDAASNWWGSTSGPSGAGPGSGDAVTANVDFDPFLIAPVVGPGCADIVGGAVTAIPSLTGSGLALLSLLLGAVGWRLLRRSAF